ncbi:MAG TPA: hypothetical protein VGG90_05640 [Candidatus Dormibacteraeota bacterium]|jgi:hypothetical protein
MATKTRPKNAPRTGSFGKGRRPPVKPSRGRDIPILPIAVGAILLALTIGLIVYIIANNKPTPGPATAAGVPCDRLEHTQVHYHAALQIVYQGNVVSIPANLGIVTDSSGSTSCFYWLHVHAQNPNVIHIESPASQTFTLGQFFAVWNTWSTAGGGPTEKLDATHVATLPVTSDQKLLVYIDLGDGHGPQPFTGDPNTIVLKSHEVITLEITPPAVTPPPPFTFTSGL